MLTRHSFQELEAHATAAICEDEIPSLTISYILQGPIEP
jgi:hypothetical protein